MGKRKLRACTKCAGRHGPPTGKGCTRTDEGFEEKIEEVTEAASGASARHENGGSEKRSELDDDVQSDSFKEHHAHIQPEVSQEQWDFMQRAGGFQPRRAAKLEDIYDPPRVPASNKF